MDEKRAMTSISDSNCFSGMFVAHIGKHRARDAG